MKFHDRRQAGRDLADWFLAWRDTRDFVDPIVLAVPRGGVPVGQELARELHAGLDVLPVRWITLPGRPESPLGAIVEEEPPIFDRPMLRLLNLTEHDLSEDVARERTELHRLDDLYRDGLPRPELAGRTVIVVSDGLSHGSIAAAALRVLRRQRPGLLLAAAPVASPDTVLALRQEADHVISLHAPEHFRAVGPWYEHFEEPTDEEVLTALRSFRTTA
ncbi:phosphoribosyltransferase [Streptomyces sp. NPDC058045]|uniref:phosphoribosyltransferase n=1 Tax=Streptomyces sp. NPDC058045 TaxID=3346311 RepID=UPI0036F0ACF0